MDTDDLSIPTYHGILLESERYNHDLTLRFGLLAANCKDDDDYLKKAEAMIKRWLNAEDFAKIADSIFFGNDVDLTSFRKVLKKVLVNISEIKKTSLLERKFEDWP